MATKRNNKAENASTVEGSTPIEGFAVELRGSTKVAVMFEGEEITLYPNTPKTFPSKEGRDLFYATASTMTNQLIII